MREKFFIFAVALAIFVACTDVPSEFYEDASTKQQYDYCILIEQGVCLNGPFTISACSGQASNNCPFDGQRSSSSGSDDLSSSSMECSSVFNPVTTFCYGGNVYSKCDGMEYNPTTHICQGMVANLAMCGGVQYNPLEQRCESDILETKCGKDGWYNDSTHFCFGAEIYSKCNGQEYDPSSRICHGTVASPAICGGQEYNPLEQRCWSDVIQLKCGNSWYNNDSTWFCFDGSVYSKCGGINYNPTTQFCYGTPPATPRQVGNKCGINPRTYDPDLYECKPSVNANGIFLKSPISYGGEDYYGVLIGTQVWLSRNLNYNATGSKCIGSMGDDGIGELLDSGGRCGTYGRLYNWATAMNLAATCNESECAEQIGAKHKGICPSGWHIPSNEDWDKLYRFADGTTGTSSPYDSPTAGKHLKAQIGWNGCSPSGSSNVCINTYGFSALPGGLGYGTSFGDAGDYGHWWSSSEVRSNSAYLRYMYHSSEPASSASSNKMYLFSVRCVQD